MDVAEAHGEPADAEENENRVEHGHGPSSRARHIAPSGERVV
jgi:hypothetical protein